MVGWPLELVRVGEVLQKKQKAPSGPQEAAWLWPLQPLQLVRMGWEVLQKKQKAHSGPHEAAWLEPQLSAMPHVQPHSACPSLEVSNCLHILQAKI